MSNEPVRLDTGIVPVSTMDDDALARAWALGYVRAIWPTIQPLEARRVAQWIVEGTDS